MNQQIQSLCAREAFYRRERRSVPLAREFTRTALADWGWARRADDVLLCVSELATNAVRHGVPPGRGFLLRLAAGDEPGGALRIEVHDSGDGEPRVPERSRAADEEAECGRGLLLVSALADAWGVGARSPGKVVWCVFASGDAGQ